MRTNDTSRTYEPYTACGAPLRNPKRDAAQSHKRCCSDACGTKNTHILAEGRKSDTNVLEEM